jgi:Pvc16 N-terminal domain
MSNYLAIATVTAAIRRLLNEEIVKIVDGVQISTGPPDKIASKPLQQNTLNIFLYQITPNIGYRNLDPLSYYGNSKSASNKNKISLGLNLNYLLSVFSEADAQDDLVVQKILGFCMQLLNEKPILTRKLINTVIHSSETSLDDSDLGDQVELVKLSLQPLSLEEITKLWSSFFQTPYRLSVAYQATVVLLDSMEEVIPSLPVKKPKLYVNPHSIRQPIIEKINPQIIEGGSDLNPPLVLQGRDLKSNKRLIVKFGEDSATILSVSDNTILVSLPDKLSAGIKPVQLMQELVLDDSLPALSENQRAFKSNILTFMLAPSVVSSPSSVQLGTNLELEIKPPVTSKQKLALLIDESIHPIPSFEILGNNKLSIPISQDHFKPGSFLLRIKIDGAESFLKFDGITNNLGPVIKITQ